KRVATFALQTDVRFASAETRKAFTEELANAVARLGGEDHRGETRGGSPFRVRRDAQGVHRGAGERGGAAGGEVSRRRNAGRTPVPLHHRRLPGRPEERGGSMTLRADVLVERRASAAAP